MILDRRMDENMNYYVNYQQRAPDRTNRLFSGSFKLNQPTSTRDKHLLYQCAYHSFCLFFSSLNKNFLHPYACVCVCVIRLE
jgi:hypothetical protein